jgi:hypothetical protein
LRKTLTALVAVLAIAPAGCARTPDNANTEKYPPEAKTNFVNKCTSEAAKTNPAGDDAQRKKSCECIVDELEKRLPYDRKQGVDSFKDADTAIRDGKPVPASVNDDLKAARDTCGQRG